MTTVFVAGALANKHRHGGSAWVRMSWAEAFRELGFEVVFVEQIAERHCVDERGAPAPFESSANIRAFHAAVEAFGFRGRAALVCSDDGRVEGMPAGELLARAEGAALLVNVSGHLRWPALLVRLPRRVFVDLDPGYTQIWSEAGSGHVGLAGHELHFTVALSVGSDSCVLPSAGVEWRPIRQPVVLDRWEPAGGCSFDGFTTVASWRGAFGPISWAGTTYGLKAHEFRRFSRLPRLAGERFAVALDIHAADAADRERLLAGGWDLVDPAETATVEGFRRFVRASAAEFSPAQGVYVETGSGWFSDRTVRYLAAGRPALVQDTGFSKHLPTGEGLLSFRDLDQARAGVRAIAADYGAHRVAARRLAAEWFAPQAALAPLLDATGVAP
jgi:hypothetical protein